MWFIRNSKLLTLVLLQIEKVWIWTPALKTGRWTCNETKEIKGYKSPYQQRDRETGRETYREFILLEVSEVSDDKDV